jgi:hypothetical protein
MSAFGGKADMAIAAKLVVQSGHAARRTERPLVAPNR